MTQTVNFRGVTIGDCNEEYTLVLPGVQGLGMPNTKDAGEVGRYGAHGVVSGPDYLEPRNIGIPVFIHRKDDPEAAMVAFRAFKTAWRPSVNEEELTILSPGYGPADDIIRFYGRPRNGLELDLSLHYTGTINTLATFTALDPVGYGPEQSQVLAVGSNTVTNPGDAPTDRARILLTGNGSAPLLSNQSLGGRSILFRSPIPAGQTWTLHLRSQTLYDASGNDKFSAISPASTWFELGAGDNTIVLTGASTGSVTFRGGWW